MFTILAWIVFLPALVWNVIIMSIAFSDLMSDTRAVNWKQKKNLMQLAVSLAVLFVPGVYLFGWF